jgi:hypothetical protein
MLFCATSCRYMTRLLKGPIIGWLTAPVAASCIDTEYAQQMAAHESARTTKLYDRRNDQVTLDQVERIVL